MKTIGDYEGGLLTHLNAIYRPEDRDLAIELAQALGLSPTLVPGSKSGIVSTHPNTDDRHMTRNVIYLAEMASEQIEADKILRKKMEADPELKECVEKYRESAGARPDSNAHFGVLYPTEAAFAPVLENLRDKLSPDLKRRVSVNEMPAYPPIAGFVDIRQTFVFTDVFTVGVASHGQLIELQVERGS